MLIRSAILWILIIYITEIAPQVIVPTILSNSEKFSKCPSEEEGCKELCINAGYVSGACGGPYSPVCTCDAEQPGADSQRGFGCPFDKYQCDSHCKGLGRKGGFCSGLLWHTCTCVQN